MSARGSSDVLTDADRRAIAIRIRWIARHARMLGLYARDERKDGAK